MKNKIDVNVTELGQYYNVNIHKDGESMSGGMIAGIVIGFIFFFIVGIILLIIWASKIDKNNISVSFNLKKENWEEELNKQLLINDLGNNTEYIKNKIIEKIKLIQSL